VERKEHDHGENYLYIYKDAGNMDCMQGTIHAMDEKTL
jgi:hypothetical protein